jgi:hypothetical protein
MRQIRDNSAEQALLGDLASAVDNAVMESADAHQSQMNQVLGNKNLAADFGRIVFDLLVAQMKTEQQGQGPPSSQRRRAGARPFARYASPWALTTCSCRTDTAQREARYRSRS